MDYLQASLETTKEETPKLKLRALNVMLNLNILAILITFILNFLGLPVLKYHYLVHIFITLISILLFDFSEIFPIILGLFFIEGQGRVVWEYESWSRIIFDSLVFLAVIKIFIKKKKIIDLSRVPVFLICMLLLHFLWYLVEFFNPNSISFFGSIAATKVYIFPFLLFLALVQIDFDVLKVNFQKSLNFFILLLVLELALTFYQVSMKESLILQISPYYFKLIREGVFAGIHYRPFGTTQLPGAVSAFLFLTVGFLFLKKWTKSGNIFRIFLIISSGAAIILCQVRSAFVKFSLIVIAIYLGELLFQRFKGKGFILMIAMVIGISSSTLLLLNSKDSTGDESLDFARDRIATLGDFEKIKGSRLNISEFFQVVSKKLIDNPLGLGPGLTGPIASLSLKEIKDSPFIKSDMKWSSDNILVALIIDFGIGAIFYILILLFIPFYFFNYLIVYYREKNYEPYKILLICFISISIILIGNWGAIGIAYNPESFVFWFFAALGFSNISKNKKNMNF